MAYSMDRERLSRMAWVGAGGLTLVVVITLLSQSGRTGRGAAEVVSLEPGHTPPPLGSTKPQPIDSGAITPEVLQASSGFNLSRVDKDTGKLKDRFIAEKNEPRPNEEFELTKPQWFRFMPSRIVHMRADTGYLLAQGNQPQSGWFKGHLVVTVFQNEFGGAVDLSTNSQDRAIQIEMESATFDATRGDIISDGPVKMTTPRTGQAELTGKGMRLIYSDVTKPPRIDYLEIERVDAIQFRPAPGSGPKTQKDAGTPAGESPVPAKDDAAVARQFYRVRFEKDVHVVRGEQTIDSDHMEAFFAIATSKVDTAPTSSGPAKPATPSRKSAKPPKESAPPTSGHEEPPITITSGGKLVMEPSDPPPKSEGGDDVYLVFTGVGSPVRVALQKDTHLTAQTVDYLGSLHLLTAVGSPTYPLRIDSPELGRLAGERLFARVDLGVGQLEGPGSIRAPEAQPAAPAGPDATEKVKRALPPGFAIEWSHHVDLKFDTGGIEPGSNAALKSATFVGAVQVGQPNPHFDLRADQVTASFVTRETGKDSRLDQIDAEGQVRVVSAEGNGEADKLRMKLRQYGDNDTAPEWLTAEGSAKFASKDESISADHLDVTFLPPGEKVKAKKAAGKTGSPGGLGFAADWATVKGRGHVRVEQKGAQALCDRLDADNVTGTYVLLAAPGSPVVVKREGGSESAFELTVPRLDATRKNDNTIAFADGKGKLVFTRAASPREQEKDKENGKGEDKEKTKPTVVTWTKRMSYDDTAGLINITGDTVAEERESDTRVKRIESRQMAIELVSREVAQKDKPESGTKKGALDADLSGRQIKKFTARDDVVVRAYELADASRDEVLWRLRIDGPKLEYMYAEDVARIIGRGTTLVEDYRPKTSDKASQRDNSMVQFSGPGTTLFTWERVATFDRIQNRMTMEQTVRMTHIPADGQDKIELSSDSLVADMKESKRVDVVGMPFGSRDLDYVEALGNVKVDQGKDMHVKADRLYYDGSKETVDLTEQPGKKVEVQDFKNVKALRGQHMQWNRRTGEWMVVQPGR